MDPSRTSARLAPRIHVLLVGVLSLAAIAVLAHRVVEPTPESQIVLSEVVASNASTLLDEDGEASDWLELYNHGPETVELDGFYLTDDRSDLQQWRFPERTLQPGEYLVVFASGKDRASGDGELHTSFRITQAGDELVLVAPDGATVMDHLKTPQVPRDASFGRAGDDLDRLCFFAFPTPGEANGSECFEDDELGAPSFSASTGFYDESFELELIAHSDGAVLYYTLDGSYPDPDSNPDATRVYDGPLRIENRTSEPNSISRIRTSTHIHRLLEEAGTRELQPTGRVQKATVVRARSERSAERVETFFVGPELRRELLPVVSLSTHPDHLFDPEIGIYVPGRLYDRYVESDEYDPDHGYDVPSNYRERGREWERPPADDLRNATVLQMCEPTGDCPINRNVGIRIHGGITRTFPQKSLRLYARNDYGSRVFEYPFFDDRGPTVQRRLILRNSGNDSRRTMLLDGYVHELIAHLAPDTQAYRPAVVFINGEYWGIHNIRERYDRHYLGITHDVDPEGVWILGPRFEVEEGRPAAAADFRAVVDLLEEQDPASAATLREVSARMDLDSFIDYMIVQIFTSNTDWPNNNVRLWRTIDGAHDGGDSPVADGRWRWLIFDLDRLGSEVGSNVVDHNNLARVAAPREDPYDWSGIPFIFSRLLENEEFRRAFVLRFSDHLNSTFHPERTVTQLDDMAAVIEAEIPHHVERWPQFIPSQERWHANVADLRRFMAERPAVQRDQIAAQFALDGFATIEVETEIGRGTVRVNELELRPETPGILDAQRWAGQYPIGVPVAVEAVPADGYRFVEWRGIEGEERYDPRLEIEFHEGLTLRPRFVSG